MSRVPLVAGSYRSQTYCHVPVQPQPSGPAPAHHRPAGPATPGPHPPQAAASRVHRHLPRPRRRLLTSRGHHHERCSLLFLLLLMAAAVAGVTLPSSGWSGRTARRPLRDAPTTGVTTPSRGTASGSRDATPAAAPPPLTRLLSGAAGSWRCGPEPLTVHQHPGDDRPSHEAVPVVGGHHLEAEQPPVEVIEAGSHPHGLADPKSPAGARARRGCPPWSARGRQHCRRRERRCRPPQPGRAAAEWPARGHHHCRRPRGVVGGDQVDQPA